MKAEDKQQQHKTNDSLMNALVGNEIESNSQSQLMEYVNDDKTTETTQVVSHI